MNDSISPRGNRISQCKQAEEKSDHIVKQTPVCTTFTWWTRQHVSNVGDSICSTVLFSQVPICTSFSRRRVKYLDSSAFPQRETAGAEVCVRLSGSELNPFDECRLQDDGEPVQCVQHAGQGVYSSTVPQ